MYESKLCKLSSVDLNRLKQFWAGDGRIFDWAEEFRSDQPIRLLRYGELLKDANYRILSTGIDLNPTRQGFYTHNGPGHYPRIKCQERHGI